jgi:hypothetical protein
LIMSSILRIVMAASVANCIWRAQDEISLKNGIN